MQYQVDTNTENGIREKRVEAASLGEAMSQASGDLLDVTIGPPGRRLPVLGPLDDTPEMLDRAAITAVLCTDDLSHLRRLVKEGEIEGRAGWFGWSVSKASLLAWAGRYAREWLKALPSPQPNCGETPEGENEPTDWLLGMDVFASPRIPERDWSDDQLRALWLRDLIPCGERGGTLLLADFGDFEECEEDEEDEDPLPAIFGCPVSTVVPSHDPQVHMDETLALWDAFWQCDDTTFLRRPHPADDEPELEPVFAPDPMVGSLLRETMGTYARKALADAGRAPEVLPEDEGPMAHALNSLAACLLGHESKRAVFRWVRQGRSVAPILTDNPDNPSAPHQTLSFWLREPALGLIGLALGLPCQQWEEEATQDIQIGEQTFTVRTKRHLDGLYGPTLELSWE